MDLPTLCTVLKCTLSPDKAQLDSATAYLARIRGTPGLAQLLMKLSVDSTLGLEAEIMLAAAIQLKNLLKDSWALPPGYDEEDELEHYLLPKDDKDFVKANLLRFICATPIKPVVRQLEACLYVVADKEFPEAWPTLLGQIKEGIQTAKDPSQFRPVLYAFTCLSKIFRYKGIDKQKEIIPLMDEVWKVLYELAAQLALSKNEAAAELLKLVAKAYYFCISFTVSPGLANEASLDGWMGIFQNAFDWPLPAEIQTPTTDPEEIKARSDLPILKMKAAISEIFYLLFQRYGNPSYPSKSYQDFCTVVQNKYVHSLFDLHLNILKLAPTQFFPPKFISVSFNLLRHSLRNPLTVDAIKPSLPEILSTIAFPYLFITPSMASTWEADQLEFIREIFEENMSDTELRSAAMSFIHAACKYKGFDHSKKKERTYHPILTQFLSFLGNVLQESVQNGKVREFEAALYAIGKVKHAIKKYPSVLEHIEPLINLYVTPGLESPIGIVKMRCCWVLSKFALIYFKNHENLLVACDKILGCLQDKHLAVRVLAAIAISRLAEKPYIGEKLKSQAPALISKYLELMAQVELNELVDALKELIRTFADAIVPYSVELIKELINAYKRMSQHSAEQDKKPSLDLLLPESGMAAAACISTISQILDIIGNRQDVLLSVEPLVISIVEISLTPQEMYILENGIELLVQLTYYKNSISPALWELYYTLMDITVGSPKDEMNKRNVKKNGSWGYEVVREVTVIFRNYIVKDPDTFLNGKTSRGGYMDMMLYFIGRILEISNANSVEFDRIPAIRLIIAIIEGLKGKIDHLFHLLVDIVAQEIKKAQIENLKHVLLQAVSMCCYYSLEQTIICLEAQGITTQVLNELFALKSDLPEDQTRRCIYGIVAMLSDPLKLPEILQKQLGKIFSLLVTLCSRMLSEPTEENDSMPDEEEDEDELGFDDYKNAILSDHKLYASPLKQIHVLYYVKKKLEELAWKDIGYYKQLEIALTDKEKGKLQQAMEKAEDLQNELLQQHK